MSRDDVSGSSLRLPGSPHVQAGAARRLTHEAARRELAGYKSRVEELERLLAQARLDLLRSSSDSCSSELPEVEPGTDPDYVHLRLPAPLGAGESSSGSGELLLLPVSSELEPDSLCRLRRRIDDPISRAPRPLSCRRKQITELNMTQAEYIEYLERFVDTKCEEVNSLIARLLRHQKYGDYDRQRLERAERAAQKHIELLNENRRLRGELASIQAAISQYAVRHRESKAERRTRELQELAAFRAESETARVDLYASILSELRQFADGIYDLDEHSVRKAVARAAQLLRETQVNCQ